MKAAIIKFHSTSTSHVTVYFDDDVLQLLDEQITNKNTFLTTVIEKMIAAKYISDTNMPEYYYISRIKRNLNGSFKLLYINSDKASVAQTVITLSSQPTVKTNDNTTSNIQLKESNLPPYLYLTNTIQLLRSYLSSLEKEKEQDIQAFLDAKNVFIPTLPAPPALILLQDNDYTFEKTVKLFPALSDLKENIGKQKLLCAEQKNHLLQIELEFNKILQEEKNDELADYLQSQLHELQTTSAIKDTLTTVNLKEKEIDDTLFHLEDGFKYYFFEHGNAKSNLCLIKRIIAWALYKAAIECFIEIQNATNNIPTERQKKLAVLNNTFDGIFTVIAKKQEKEKAFIYIFPIDMAYAKFDDMSLTDIGQEVQLLLTKCNTTWWVNSTQLGIVFRCLDEAKRIFQSILKTNDDLISTTNTSWEKTSFSWSPSLLNYEQILIKKMEQSADEIQQKSIQLKNISLVEDQGKQTIADRNFTEFKIRIRAHKKLLTLKKVAVVIQKKTCELEEEEKNIGELIKKIEQIPQEKQEALFAKYDLSLDGKNIMGEIDSKYPNQRDDIQVINDRYKYITSLSELDQKNRAAQLKTIAEDTDKVKAAYKRTVEPKLKDLMPTKQQLENYYHFMQCFDELTHYQNLAEQIFLEANKKLGSLKKRYKEIIQSQDGFSTIDLEREYQALSHYYADLKNNYETIYKQKLSLEGVTRSDEIKFIREKNHHLDLVFQELNASYEALTNRCDNLQSPPPPPPSYLHDKDELTPSVISIKTTNKKTGDTSSFLKRHWGEIVAGGLATAGIVALGAFTFGTGLLIMGVVAAVGLIVGMAGGAAAGAIEDCSRSPDKKEENKGLLADYDDRTETLLEQKSPSSTRWMHSQLGPSYPRSATESPKKSISTPPVLREATDPAPSAYFSPMACRK